MLEQRKRMFKTAALIMFPLILVAVIRCAPVKGRDLMEYINNLTDDLAKDPLGFRWSIRILPAVLGFSFIYFMVWLIIISSMKNTRPGEEHGSAKWVDPRRISKILKAKKDTETHKKHQRDIIFTENVRVAIDSECDNINTLIIGGAGRLKTRGFIIPNIIQLNCNPVVTDPKGEILRKTGKLLKDAGYDVRVLDLVEHYKSFGYNPFPYFRNDDDILLFVNNMWAAMSDKTAAKGEQIWDDQARNMMMSFCLFLYHYAPADEQNMDSVITIFINIDDSEQKKDPDPVDRMFDRIDHSDTAYTYYKMWSAAKGRTLASIRATFSARMSVFNLESMKKLTFKDEMNILDLATKKVAVFMIIPDNNSVYNFLAGTLYTQMFQQLYDYADHKVKGPLPRHVRFFMDEFANIALPDDYQKILSTSRSRNISFVIVLQDKQQIEAIFEKYYRTIYSNCAWQLFLGSLELETCKYYSELLGKETITGYTYTKQYGLKGGSSRQTQLIERDLMKPDELRGLPKKRCVLYTPYYGVALDNKYNLIRHPFYKRIADRKGDTPYDWGETPLVVGSVSVVDNRYSGRITPLPKADGYLMDTLEYDG